MSAIRFEDSASVSGSTCTMYSWSLIGFQCLWADWTTKRGFIVYGASMSVCILLKARQFNLYAKFLCQVQMHLLKHVK